MRNSSADVNDVTLYKINPCILSLKTQICHVLFIFIKKKSSEVTLNSEKAEFLFPSCNISVGAIKFLTVRLFQ